MNVSDLLNYQLEFPTPLYFDDWQKFGLLHEHHYLGYAYGFFINDKDGFVLDNDVFWLLINGKTILSSQKIIKTT